ncbi:MAG: hypothetical protein MSG64_06525 [Pyrinomonadaceae bacterium MAG19_C2-C3]|nr:hypothetical protein [Pyrinomonadaceae bacterium MAG19_C2-C3]
MSTQIDMFTEIHAAERVNVDLRAAVINIAKILGYKTATDEVDAIAAHAKKMLDMESNRTGNGILECVEYAITINAIWRSDPTWGVTRAAIL